MKLNVFFSVYIQRKKKISLDERKQIESLFKICRPISVYLMRKLYQGIIKNFSHKNIYKTEYTKRDKELRRLRFCFLIFFTRRETKGYIFYMDEKTNKELTKILFFPISIRLIYCQTSILLRVWVRIKVREKSLPPHSIPHLLL